jgi:hypothetical protein
MIPSQDIPDIITFELLKFQRNPLRFLLEHVSHVTREGLLQKIFTEGLVAMITEVMAAEEDEGDHKCAVGAIAFLAQGEPISPHPFQRIPAQMNVNLTRLQQLALSDLLQHERLKDPQELLAQVINTGLHSMYDAETGADLELSVEEQIEVARKAKRPPVAPAFASANGASYLSASKKDRTQRRQKRLSLLQALLDREV